MLFFGEGKGQPALELAERLLDSPESNEGKMGESLSRRVGGGRI